MYTDITLRVNQNVTEIGICRLVIKTKPIFVNEWQFLEVSNNILFFFSFCARNLNTLSEVTSTIQLSYSPLTLVSERNISFFLLMLVKLNQQDMLNLYSGFLFEYVIHRKNCVFN